MDRVVAQLLAEIDDIQSDGSAQGEVFIIGERAGRKQSLAMRRAEQCVN